VHISAQQVELACSPTLRAAQLQAEAPKTSARRRHTCGHSCQVLLCSGSAVGRAGALILAVLPLLPLESHSIPAGGR